jgi:site-specific recombinase XerD
MPFFFTTIHNQKGHMSRRNVERIVKKYADQTRREHTDLPDSVYPHLLRRTRASELYQDGVDITAISTLLGHSLLQTTKDHYVHPSIEQLRKAMESNLPETSEEQLWPDDEDELARLCGLK